MKLAVTTGPLGHTAQGNSPGARSQLTVRHFADRQIGGSAGRQSGGLATLTARWASSQTSAVPRGVSHVAVCHRPRVFHDHGAIL